ncbi:hypothetical protein D3C87_1884390 [compost metagenome]
MSRKASVSSAPTAAKSLSVSAWNCSASAGSTMKKRRWVVRASRVAWVVSSISSAGTKKSVTEGSHSSLQR